jgi:hypothetical protein
MVNIIMPTFLRSPATAPRVFGADSPGQLYTAVPRFKFDFVTEFQLTQSGLAMTNQAKLNERTSDRNIVFKVRQITKPRITLMTETLNQYNKKRIVYKKLDYQETSLRIYDTVDNSMLSLWVDYFTYFFGDSRPKNKNAYMQGVADPSFIDDTGWGFRPLVSGNNSTNFFEYIKIIAFYARTYTAFKYINPKITSIDFGEKDYSQSEVEEINVNFAYEAIEYETFGQPVDNQDIIRWGWSPYDQLNVASPPPIRAKTSEPRIFANQLSQAVNPTSTSGTLQQLAGITNQSFQGVNPDELIVNIAAQINPQPTSAVQVQQPAQSFGGQTAEFGEPPTAASQIISSLSSLTPDQQETAIVANNFQQQPTAVNRISIPSGATPFTANGVVVGYEEEDGSIVKFSPLSPEQKKALDAAALLQTRV